MDTETLNLAEQLGEDADKEKLPTLANFGRALACEERHEEAELILRRAADVSESMLGPQHAETQELIGAVAFSVAKQGKIKQALELWQHVLDYRLKVFGLEDAETLRILWCQSVAHSHDGNLLQAETGFQTLVNVRSQGSMASERHLFEPLLQLAWVKQQRGNYSESETNYRRFLELNVRLNGSEDHLTLRALHNLASVLKYRVPTSQEAEALLWEACKGREKTLGAKDSSTINSRAFLAVHLEDLGKYAEAEKLRQELADLDIPAAEETSSNEEEQAMASTIVLPPKDS